MSKFFPSEHAPAPATRARRLTKRAACLLVPGLKTKLVPGFKRIIYLKVLGFSVSYTDFPKKGEYLSLVSLSTNPPQVQPYHHHHHHHRHCHCPHPVRRCLMVQEPPSKAATIMQLTQLLRHSPAMGLILWSKMGNTSASLIYI